MAEKLLNEELALYLTEKLLNNDKRLYDELVEKINNITLEQGVFPTISLQRTENDDGIIISVTDVNGTSSDTVYDGENGKNAQVAKIEPIVGGNRITFLYYDDSNTQQLASVDIMNGEDGTSVTSATIKDGNELILSMSDGTEVSAGVISIQSDNLTLDNYYTKEEVEQLIENKITERISDVSSEEIISLF